MYIVTLLLSQGVIIFGQVADAERLSLSDCIGIGLANNLSVKQAELETKKERYRLREAIGEGLPRIGGTVSLDYYPAIPVTMVPGELVGQPGTTVPVKLGSEYYAEAGVSAGQLIYSASYFASIRIFRKSCEISDLKLRKGREELAYNIASLYLFIQVSSRQLSLIDSNIVAVETIRGYSEQNFANGIITRSDLERVILIRNSLLYERESLVLEREKQLNMLKYLLCIDAGKTISLYDDIEEPIDADPMEEITPESHTDLQIIKQKAELSDLSTRLTKAALVPSVETYAAYSYMAPTEELNDIGNGKNWYNMSFIGIKVTVPILAGGATRHKVYQSRIESGQARIAQQDLINSIDMQYNNAKTQFMTYNLLESAMMENMQRSETLFRIIAEQYFQGVKTLTDVLNARTEYNSSQLSWLNALLRKRMAELEIMKVTGSINDLIK